MILLALACIQKLDGPAIDTATQDADADGVEWIDDCDDNDASVGEAATWYADTDGDGFGWADTTTTACEQPNAFVADATDCDDDDGSVNPGADEVCNGVDDDCDGALDADDDSVDLSSGRLYFADLDEDGYGDALDAVEACSVPEGYTLTDDDCDDQDADVNPGAAEVCNGVDDDCDGTVDDTAVDATTWYLDDDGDGFGGATSVVACDAPADHVDVDGDCDDWNADANPDELEWCDGFDNDCDGDTDEADAEDAPTWYDDGDEDGFGDPDDSWVACDAPDGHVADDTDCADTDNDVFPGADELCNDEDDDCDGTIDEPDATDAETWYADTDGDGFGDPATATAACDTPTGYLDDDSDCDDTDADVNPDADELCDGIDNDCDGTADNDDALDADTWYADTDGDSYGDATSTTTACDQPSGYVADDTDCEDGDADAFPDSTSTETPGDGIDTDCDGNDFCTDLDCDGRGDLATAQNYSGTSYSGALTIFHNDGNGSFSDTDTTTLATNGTYALRAHDLDDDGYQDLIVANYYDGSTRYLDSTVYWGSASGHSTSDRTDLATIGALDIGIGDFDGDGYDDLAFANHHNNSNYLVDNYVYWGSSTGFSESNRTSLTGYGTRRVAVADLDADGYDDLVACHYYSGSSFAVDAVVWYGSSSGFSSSSTDSLPVTGCLDVHVHDWDDDGYDDIALASYYSGSGYSSTSYVYYGASTGFSSTDRDSVSTTGATAVVDGDFDGDGDHDVAFSGYYSGSWAYTATTTVGYGTSTGFATTTSHGSRGVYNLDVADLDGDGYDELLGARYYTGSQYLADSTVWWGDASGLSDSNVLELEGYGTSSLLAADLDRDGVQDVVMAGYYTGSWATMGDNTLFYGSGYTSALATTLSNGGVWAPVIFVGR